MALVIKKILAIYECKRKDIKPKEGGDDIVNYNCAGITEKDEVFRFSSPVELTAHDLEGFDEDVAEEITLKVSEWDGKKKYRVVQK